MKRESESLIAIFNDLSVREKNVLIRRMICAQTLEEVGKVYGCTRERVRQTEAKALQKLRVYPFSKRPRLAWYIYQLENIESYLLSQQKAEE